MLRGFVSAVLVSSVALTSGAADWGNIKGRVVWGGSSLPEVKNLDVSKDTDYCLKEGPIKDETIVVDPETKGVANVFIYLVKPTAIHESYPKDAAAVAAADAKAFAELNNGLEFNEKAINAAVAAGKVKIKDLKAPNLLDQIYCRYVPHALAVREGQKVLVLNPETIAHNVKISGLSGKNDANPTMPPGSLVVFDWKSETNPLNVECSIHGWMKMLSMVFDHPYFAVTGKDGSFELKNVPAGAQAIVVRYPKFIPLKAGSKMTARGEKITIKPNETLDLGEIKVQP
jgi:hypothetical protein